MNVTPVHHSPQGAPGSARSREPASWMTVTHQRGGQDSSLARSTVTEGEQTQMIPIGGGRLFDVAPSSGRNHGPVCLLTVKGVITNSVLIACTFLRSCYMRVRYSDKTRFYGRRFHSIFFCLLTKAIPTFVLVPDYELLHPLSMSWHVELVTEHQRSAKRRQNKEGRDET